MIGAQEPSSFYNLCQTPMFPTSLQNPYGNRSRRRGRNDPNSRDYICPCGKSYLSYPALFTHIKIKHNGRAPGQIIKPRPENSSRRGRPKQKEVYDQDSDTEDMAGHCIDQLCDFIMEVDKPEHTRSSKLKDIYAKEHIYHLYVNFNPQEQEPKYDEENELYEENCANVFCEILTEINKRVNQPYYIHVMFLFFVILSKSLQEAKTRNKEQKHSQKKITFSNENKANSSSQERKEEDNQLNERVQSSSIQKEINVSQSKNGSYPGSQVGNISEQLISEEENSEKSMGQEGSQNAQQSCSKEELDQEEGQQRENNDEPQYVEEIEQAEEVEEIEDQYNNLEKDNSQEENLVEHLQKNNKVLNEPIACLVNYANSFACTYLPKYVLQLKLQDIPLFQEQNLLKLLGMFYSFLTQRKYLPFKVRLNPKYSSGPSSNSYPTETLKQPAQPKE